MRKRPPPIITRLSTSLSWIAKCCIVVKQSILGLFVYSIIIHFIRTMTSFSLDKVQVCHKADKLTDRQTDRQTVTPAIAKAHYAYCCAMTRNSRLRHLHSSVRLLLPFACYGNAGTDIYNGCRTLAAAEASYYDRERSCSLSKLYLS